MLLTLRIQSDLANSQLLEVEDFKTPTYEGDINIDLQRYENQRILGGSLFSEP